MLSRKFILSMSKEGSRYNSVVFTIPGDGTVEHIWEQPSVKDEDSPEIHAMMGAVAKDVFCSWCADLAGRHCLLDDMGLWPELGDGYGGVMGMARGLIESGRSPME